MDIRSLALTCASIMFGITGVANAVADEGQESSEIVQFGTMHTAIGQQQHEGRVRLSELLRRPHFYGVAAPERLQGEVTIFDGQITITTVKNQQRLIESIGSTTKKRHLCPVTNTN